MKEGFSKKFSRRHRKSTQNHGKFSLCPVSPQSEKQKINTVSVFWTRILSSIKLVLLVLKPVQLLKWCETSETIRKLWMNMHAGSPADSWWGQYLNVQRSLCWLLLFLSTGDSVHLISLVFLQCHIGLEVVIGTTWGLMSLELRHSLFHIAEHCYIIRFHLWSKGKLIFHVPPLYATYKRLHCFKRKILG